MSDNISDMDPHWSYADLEPQNLVNTDPGRVQDKKKYIFKSVPEPLEISYFFSFRLRNIISYQKQKFVA